MSFTSGRRDIWTVALAKGVSLFGDLMATMALVLRLQGSGAGAGPVAALLIADLVPIVLLTGLVGRLVDRLPARQLLVWSGLLQATLCVALTAVGSTIGMLALVLLLGAGTAISGATWQALVPSLVRADEMPRAIGLTQMCSTAAAIAAPAAGGVLVGTFGARVPLLVDAASFVLVAAAALVLRTRPVPVASDGAARGGFAIVRRDALLRPLFLLLALFVLLGSLVNVVDVFLVREVLHASTTSYGLVSATMAVGMFVGAALGGRIPAVGLRARWFVGSCFVLAVCLIGLGVAPGVALALPISFVLGVGNGLLNVTLGGLVMGRAAAGERGRVAAMLSGTASGCQLLAYLASGTLSAVLGPRQLFVLAGALGLLAPLLLGRALVRAADLAACQPLHPTPTSLPSAGGSLPPAASPVLSRAT